MVAQKQYKHWIYLVIISFSVFAGIFIAFLLDHDLSHHPLWALLLAVVTALICLAAIFFLYSSNNHITLERGILREVFEGSRAARIITNNAGKTIYSNHKFSVLCDVKPEHASVQSLEKLFGSDKDAMATIRLLSENAERGGSDSAILKSKHSGKKGRWYQLLVQPVAGWAGYVHWRVDDITDQHNVQELIKEEREKLVNFTDNAPVGFFSVDQNGKFLFINETLCNWLGYSRKEMLKNITLHDFFDKPPKKSRPYDILEKGGAKQVTETFLKKKNGETILAAISQSVLVEVGGDVRTNAVVHDLTSEKQMIKALEASENRFQKFFEEAPLGVILLNEEGKVTDCNAILLSFLNTDTEKVTGRDFVSIVKKEDQKDVERAIKALEKGKGFDKGLEIGLKLDGMECSVEMHARRFKESQSVVLHFIDLTEKKSLEEQFVQSQKMQAIGQLAGGVAHDFNNLLTAMIGFCDLLLIRHKPGDPSFSDISQIKQNANRASNLVRQLLAFSRQQTLRPKVLDVTDTLTELSHLLRRLLGANIVLEVEHGEDLGLIKVDEGQLEQVLINMAVNARDAMLETGNDGTLIIATKNFQNKKTLSFGSDSMPVGHWIRIDIKDTGCGIPPEIMDRIFEPFFTTKEIGSGTGLGLATVYGIVRQTGGYISVASVVDEGTTFSLFFPVVDEGDNAEDAKEQQVEENQDLTGTARILLIEDEDAVRIFSARALMSKGYDVLEANGGEQALEAVQKVVDDGVKLDLIISDVIMPGMDGPELIKEIQTKISDMKIIFISGYTEDKFKDELGDDVHFLPKPFTLEGLTKKVKEVLD